MKRLIFKALIVTFAWLMLSFSPLLAHAQEATPDSLKTARAILAKTKVADTIAPLLDQMLTAQFQSQAKRAKNPQQSALIMQMGGKLRERFKARMPELLHLNAALYAKYFTAAELQELLAFYNTPLGAKLISTQPKLMTEAVGVSQAWAQKFTQEEMPKIVAEMKAAAAEKPL